MQRKSALSLLDYSSVNSNIIKEFGMSFSLCLYVINADSVVET